MAVKCAVCEKELVTDLEIFGDPRAPVCQSCWLADASNDPDDIDGADALFSKYLEALRAINERAKELRLRRGLYSRKIPSLNNEADWICLRQRELKQKLNHLLLEWPMLGDCLLPSEVEYLGYGVEY